ncbi:MAG TPA: AraC family transcriptional regulator [Cytophagales bacterium]|nr:AraC family transcriptional regulator [Cytophagales bacterium]HAP61680.1 AraC family transcriptional regulator [Cytophagales bacterium]
MQAHSMNDFIQEAERIVLEQVSNEQFGVSELAEAMSMSRSNLLRKIKQHTEQSASVFIREVRLKKAMELLQQGSLTVSEVSYEVGFGSVSYFVKCFREYYGHPPGQVGQNSEPESIPAEETSAPKKPALQLSWKAMAGIAAGIALVVLVVVLSNRLTAPSVEIDKSIAVLPFKNESSDSSNLYFINGLMESTLNNLQKIGDLRVISRTSSEKYRNSGKTLPEIAEELQVNYVVEGSGQKVGDQVLLNIQLVEAATDRQIWNEQYTREVTDIFALQKEVAQQITGSIRAVVTPAEREQLARRPTDNLVAYDYFLQAQEYFHTRTPEGYLAAIPLYEKAIAEDESFAHAYANMAISYYLLDIFKREPEYTEQINRFSDQALLYDPQSDVSLLAKAFFYFHTKEFSLALPHLEKALEYNPNSSAALQMLSEYYAFRVPNTAKYLEYALRGIQLEVMGQDSVTNSYGYLQLSNALLQAGFLKEAEKYVDLSLDYFPRNPFGPHLKIFTQFAQDGNARRTADLLIKEWKKDTTRVDILQDIGKIYYTLEQYDSAHFWFEKLVYQRQSRGLDVYLNNNAMMAYVYQKLGFEEEAARLFAVYVDYVAQDETRYQSMNLAVQFAYQQQVDVAMEQLMVFSTQENYQYWLLLLEHDPIMAPLRTHPDFPVVIQDIKDRFWEDHEKLRIKLEEQGLI